MHDVRAEWLGGIFGGKYTRLISGVSSKSYEEIFRMAAVCEKREQADSALCAIHGCTQPYERRVER